MTSENLQYLFLRDFQPGIYSRVGADRWESAVLPGHTPANQEEAAIALADETYGCFGLPAGGLAPMPKRTFELTVNDSDLPGSPSVGYITGALLFGPMFAASSAGPSAGGGGWPTSGSNPSGAHAATGYPAINPRETPSTALRGFWPTDLHVGLEWIRSDNNMREWRHRRYRLYDAVDGAIPSATGISTESGAATVITTKMPATYFIAHRINFWNTTPPIEPGIPLVKVSWMNMDVGTVQSYWYPGWDPIGSPIGRDHLASDSPLGPGLAVSGGPLVSHQGRAVAFTRAKHPHGTGFDALAQNEEVRWTQIGNQFEGSNGGQVFTHDIPFGFGAWGSITSTDLLLIKHEGAVLIQGDLNNPIVRRLPGVTGTGGIECLGAQTSLGFIYGRNKGSVYAWQGGDESVDLAPQLHRNFWIDHVNPSDMLDMMGGFCEWDDWIIAPNGWWFNKITKSWWRIYKMNDAVLEHAYWPMVVPKTSDLIVLSNRYVGAKIGNAYSALSGTDVYRYRSQVFKRTVGRMVDVREVVLLARGLGATGSDSTVTITVFGLSASGAVVSAAKAFSVPNTASSTHPHLFRASISVLAESISVRIDAQAPAGFPAPVVHEVAIGYDERQLVPNS